MANRKGVKQVSKWTCSDGKEFISARDANDHQGAVNELEKYFNSFKTLEARGSLSDESLRSLIFDWELHKNRCEEGGLLDGLDDGSGSNVPEPPANLLIRNEADEESSSAMDTSSSGSVPERDEEIAELQSASEHAVDKKASKAKAK